MYDDISLIYKISYRTLTIVLVRMSWGDCYVPWSLHSISKPLTYGIALHENGAEYVHNYVGHEPSGRLFNEICLDHNGTI